MGNSVGTNNNNNKTFFGVQADNFTNKNFDQLNMEKKMEWRQARINSLDSESNKAKELINTVKEIAVSFFYNAYSCR